MTFEFMSLRTGDIVICSESLRWEYFLIAANQNKCVAVTVAASAFTYNSDNFLCCNHVL